MRQYQYFAKQISCAIHKFNVISPEWGSPCITGFFKFCPFRSFLLLKGSTIIYAVKACGHNYSIFSMNFKRQAHEFMTEFQVDHLRITSGHSSAGCCHEVMSLGGVETYDGERSGGIARDVVCSLLFSCCEYFDGRVKRIKVILFV